MMDFLSTPTAQIVIGFAGLAAIIVVAIYVVGKVRAEWLGNDSQTNEILTNFRELKESGQLSDAEYRTIKGMLAAKLTAELKDNGEKR
jgi:hypothetical protein